MSAQEHHLLIPRHPGDRFISLLKSCKINLNEGKVLRKGKELGSYHPNGRWYITLGGIKRSRTHIIWWAGMNEWPTTIIDHENRNPSDDRFDNLLPATPEENTLNSARFDHRVHEQMDTCTLISGQELSIHPQAPVSMYGVMLCGAKTLVSR